LFSCADVLKGFSPLPFRRLTGIFKRLVFISFVMDKHSRVVTEHYLKAENCLEDAWYDTVLREEPYFAEEDTPLARNEPDFPKGGVGGKGRMVGEVDVWLLNYDERLMMPIEVKTSYGDIGYGREQLERVDEHFSDWSVLKKLVLEP